VKFADSKVSLLQQPSGRKSSIGGIITVSTPSLQWVARHAGWLAAGGYSVRQAMVERLRQSIDSAFDVCQHRY